MGHNKVITHGVRSGRRPEFRLGRDGAVATRGMFARIQLRALGRTRTQFSRPIDGLANDRCL